MKGNSFDKIFYKTKARLYQAGFVIHLKISVTAENPFHLSIAK